MTDKQREAIFKAIKKNQEILNRKTTEALAKFEEIKRTGDRQAAAALDKELALLQEHSRKNTEQLQEFMDVIKKKMDSEKEREARKKIAN